MKNEEKQSELDYLVKIIEGADDAHLTIAEAILLAGYRRVEVKQPLKDKLYVFAGFRGHDCRPCGTFEGGYTRNQLFAIVPQLQRDYDWYEVWTVDEDGLKYRMGWESEGYAICRRNGLLGQRS